jgi:DNA-binding NarL/FixJ family response regulator
MTAAQATSRSGSRAEPPESRAALRPRLRVLVVDEPGIMREGVSALLEDIPEIEVIGSAPVGIEALKTAAALQAQMIVLELPVGARGGSRLIATFKAQLPGSHVIVLTFHREASIVEAALRAGADGYVLKSDSRAELFAAIASITAGKTFVTPSLRRLAAADELAVRTPELTERELQVIRLIAAGRRTREIAKLLSLSHKTIEKHRTSLMRKLGLRNATAVAAYAIMTGLAEE